MASTLPPKSEAETPVDTAAHLSDVAPPLAAHEHAGITGLKDDHPPSGVAQLFVEWKGLTEKQQCQQIFDAVKCLITKGYKSVGLTYSANQNPQIRDIFKAYNYNPDPKISTNTFEIGVAKTITQIPIAGVHQANILASLDSVTDDEFRKVFRIIPLSTMKIGGGGEDVDSSIPGDSAQCIRYVEQFLALPNSIILGWCDPDTKKNLSLSNLKSTELTDIDKLVDDAYTLNGDVPTDKIQAHFTDPKTGLNTFLDKTKSVVNKNPKTGVEYLAKRKKHINIGGEMAETTTNTRTTYIPLYLKTLIRRWNPDAQRIVDECQSANPPPTPKPKPAVDSTPPKDAAPSTSSSTSSTSPSTDAPAGSALIGKPAFDISGATGDFQNMINQQFNYQSYDKTTETFSYISMDGNVVVTFNNTSSQWEIKKGDANVAYNGCTIVDGTKEKGKTPDTCISKNWQVKTKDDFSSIFKWINNTLKFTIINPPPYSTPASKLGGATAPAPVVSSSSIKETTPAPTIDNRTFVQVLDELLKTYDFKSKKDITCNNDNGELTKPDPTLDLLVSSFYKPSSSNANLFMQAYYFCRNMRNSFSFLMSKDPKYTQLVNNRKNCFLLMCDDITKSSIPEDDTAAQIPAPAPSAATSLSPENSLQQMIEYYSQNGDASQDEKARFKELNIREKPVIDWEIPSGESPEPVTGLDQRFCAGIQSSGSNTCFFATALQYLMSNEYFLKIMIELNSKPDNVDNFVNNIDVNSNLYDSNATTLVKKCKTNIQNSRDVLKKLLLIFRWWRHQMPFNENDVNNINAIKAVDDLYKLLGFQLNEQADASEVVTQIVAAIECLDNIYVDKFIRNGIKYETYTTTIYPPVGSYTRDSVPRFVTDAGTPISPPGLDEHIQSDISDPQCRNLMNTKVTPSKPYSVQDTIDSLSVTDDTQEYEIEPTYLVNYPTRNLVFQVIAQINGKFYDGSNLDGCTLIGFLKYICNTISNPSKINEKNVASILQNLRMLCDIKQKDGVERCYGIVKLLETLSTITDNEETKKDIEKIFSNYYTKKTDKLTFDNLTTSVKNQFEEINKMLLTFFKTLNVSDTNDAKLQKLKQTFTKDYCLANITTTWLGLLETIMTHPYSDEGIPVTFQKKQKVTFGEYIMFNYKRTGFTSSGNVRYDYEITIDEHIHVNSKKYILVGFTSHSYTGNSGHYVFVKCDTSGKPVLYISDTTLYKYNGEFYREGYKWANGVVSVIYKQVGKEPSVPIHETAQPSITATPIVTSTIANADTIKGYIREAIGDTDIEDTYDSDTEGGAVVNYRRGIEIGGGKTCKAEKLRVIKLSDSFLDKARAIARCYNSVYYFPAWVCTTDTAIQKKIQECLSSAKVYYDRGDSLKDVVTLAVQREPTNIMFPGEPSETIKYDKPKLECMFGYSSSPYARTSLNIAVYTQTPYYTFCDSYSRYGDFQENQTNMQSILPPVSGSLTENPKENLNYPFMHVVHAYAPAFDSIEQPDYKRYAALNGDDPTKETAKEEYKKDIQKMLSKISKAYDDFKNGKTDARLILTGIGQANFATQSYLILGGNRTETCNNIYRDCVKDFFNNDDSVFYSLYKPGQEYTKTENDPFHENRMLVNIDYINEFNINGDNRYKLNIPDGQTLGDNILWVNAWDPFSMLGNGNYNDGSVDGYFGRKTAISVIGWPVTNPDITFEEIDYRAILSQKRSIKDPLKEHTESGGGHIKKKLIRKKIYRNVSKITNNTSRKRINLTEVFKAKKSNNKTLRKK